MAFGPQLELWPVQHSLSVKELTVSLLTNVGLVGEVEVVLLLLRAEVGLVRGRV